MLGLGPVVLAGLLLLASVSPTSASKVISTVASNEAGGVGT